MLLKLRRALLPALLLVACTSLYADVTMRMHGILRSTCVAQRDAAVAFQRDPDAHQGRPRLRRIGLSSPSRFATAKYAARPKPAIRHDCHGGLPVQGRRARQNSRTCRASQAILAKMKFDAESHDTGPPTASTASTLRARVVVNISIPVPIPGQENGLQLSLKFQIWKPKRRVRSRTGAARIGRLQ